MTAGLARRLVAEFTGTGLLAAVAVGSGIAAVRLTGDGALRLLVNSTVTALGLAVLILVFTPAGGAHFNPLVTAADWLLTRTCGPGAAAGVVVVQLAGAIAGTMLAEVMFTAPVAVLSAHHRDGLGLVVSEVVATAGLLLLITALARTGRTAHAPWSVGAWIGAAYWFTASTSFANPAITLGRMFTTSYAGIAPASAPAFVVAQLAGAALGVSLAVVLYPVPAGWAGPADQAASLTG